ncbi:PIG-L family deacetylase [Steroidobacter sp. S1-65]|uniref:PIG-L family deacetylase n=1 Tax=Steroidobacter gossypii TaxID=2805490 RepID=A0ABS1X554_9GAMM|nr:PIG-L family deacetylase [Steroidobacter gossypii]MBM0108353.1 PIG-L family deacetylase [Steroidobacter gossypii]
MNLLTKVLLKRLSRAARPYLQSSGLLQVSAVYNHSAMVWQPGGEKVLVLAPHMDDEAIGCGGTLALHSQRGAQITVVFLTDGRNGNSEINTMYGEERARKQQEFIELRTTEARAALHRLGVNRMVCLDAEDGALDQCTWAAEKLREVLLRQQPDIVYLPFYLEEHSDHRAASQVLLDAASGTSLQFQCMGYEVWTPLFPNCLVRIDSTVEIKKQALQEYRSQLQQCDYLHASIGLNAHRSAGLLNPEGSRGGYAEAFYSSSLPEYREQFTAFRAH